MLSMHEKPCYPRLEGSGPFLSVVAKLPSRNVSFLMPWFWHRVYLAKLQDWPNYDIVLPLSGAVDTKA
jgi:hypothetical protein